MCAACDAAWAEFDAWLMDQSDDVQEMSLLDQIAISMPTVKPNKET